MAANGKRVKEILSWYRADNPGTLTNLARMLNHGRLGGTGKLVILPVDQGFEHGPARSFAPNPAGYDPRYHFELAIDAGCNAYAAPLGFLEAGAAEFAGEIPLILKLNNSDSLYGGSDPCPAHHRQRRRRAAPRLRGDRLHDLPGLGARATRCTSRSASSPRRRSARASPSWCGRTRAARASRRRARPRSTSCAYAAQIAAQLGAHIIKVKPPTAHIEQDAAKKVYEKRAHPDRDARRARAPRRAERLRRPPHRDLLGRRGQGARTRCSTRSAASRDGGGFGSIIGRNSFQRPKSEAIELLHEVMDIYANA